MGLKLDRLNPDYAANKALTKMRYQDLKAACIVRGMDFQDIVEGDYPTLAGWFVKNHDNKQNRELLEMFDQWVDDHLKQRGYKKNDPLRQFRQHSSLTADNDVKVRTRKLKGADIGKKKRIKKERDATFGIFKGTKKDYTFTQCADLFNKKRVDDDGKDRTVKDFQKAYGDKMVERVQKKFPDAKEKSVKIWMKRCLDELYKKNPRKD